MLKRFEIIAGKLTESARNEAPVSVFVDPDEQEKRLLASDFHIDEHTLASALDPDEPSRLELDGAHSTVILKTPRNFMGKGQLLFKVASIGMFLYPDRLVLVMSEDLPLFSGKHFRAVNSIHDAYLKVIASSILHFLEHLKVINMISEEIEGKINASMENKFLLNLFSLEKSLVYYLNAITANGFVFEKLKNHGSKLGFSPESIAYLDDITIENTQCYRQAEIYSNILASLMNARVSIVSNNLNILMKELNAFVVAVMVPSFFTGVGGMSEWSMITQGMDWRLSYGLFLLAMLLLGAGTYYAIRKMERR
ncbi:MAG: magnesium transporter CorA family protein [Elusimicrobiota bacterium]|jgi:magnesium transporter